MLGKKKPEAAPLEFEAQATARNARGMVYTLNGKPFPPGEWVEVTPGEAATLRWYEWASVREKEAV